MREISPDSISKLFVYECRGPQPPGSEPKSAAFLGLWREPPYYYLFFGGPALPSVRCWLETQPGWQLRDVPHASGLEGVQSQELRLVRLPYRPDD